MSPKYPQLDGPAPMVFTPDHFREVDAAMRELAIVDHLLRKCEACNMPVQALRQECDDACRFFLAFNQEWREPDAPLTTPMHS